ncbi:MAG: TRAP transporter small permease subunit [Pseudomonadota bacterium]
MTKEKQTEPVIAAVLDRILLGIGHAASWLIAVLIGVILLQVVLRYLFNFSHVALEEIQWHLYAVVILMGLAHAQTTNSHIRLDVLHLGFSRKTKELVEILGILGFLMPMIYVFFFHSLNFVTESWMVSERSDAPLGLACRWAIKSMIPISFGLLFIAALSRLIRAFHYLWTLKRENRHGR